LIISFTFHLPFHGDFLRVNHTIKSCTSKRKKWFNLDDIDKEFCFIYGELGEAYDAYRKNKDNVGEELADVAIYLLGISEMLGVDLEEEIKDKIIKNSERKYKNIKGVNIKVEK